MKWLTWWIRWCPLQQCPSPVASSCRGWGSSAHPSAKQRRLPEAEGFWPLHPHWRLCSSSVSCCPYQRRLAIAGNYRLSSAPVAVDIRAIRPIRPVESSGFCAMASTRLLRLPFYRFTVRPKFINCNFVGETHKAFCFISYSDFISMQPKRSIDPIPIQRIPPPSPLLDTKWTKWIKQCQLLDLWHWKSTRMTIMKINWPVHDMLLAFNWVHSVSSNHISL